jgi:hypothetical protein
VCRNGGGDRCSQRCRLQPSSATQSVSQTSTSRPLQRPIVLSPSIFLMKTVALSRQARDNHRETDQERHVRRRWQRWTHGDRVSGLQHPAAVLPMKHDDSPRHARDKHKENSRKGWRFAQRTVELTVGGGGSHELAPPQPGAMGAAAAGHGAVVWAGACIWWETGFSSDRDHESAGSVVLTTEPGRAATHWGQLLLVDDHAPRVLRKGDKVQLEGLRMVRDPAFKRNYIVVRQRSCFS